MLRRLLIALAVLLVAADGILAPAACGQALDETITPTPEAMQMETSTFTPTSTPTPQGADGYEPNDLPEQAKLVGVGVSVNATLHIGDVDWWQVYLKAGRTYRLEAIAKPGGDPRAALYSPTVALLAQNDDCGPGNYSSCIVYTVLGAADGYYYLEIASQVTGLFAEYTLRIIEELPTPTPTSTPTLTPPPAPTATAQPTATPYNDAYEPNYDFAHAAQIVAGQGVNASITPGDNDFYALYVKPGNTYRCDVNPQGGLDTNLIVYDAGYAGIGGNDDMAPGNPGSSLTWYATYQGWVYLLIGPVAGSGSYTLLCTVLLPTATPTPTPPARPALSGGGGVEATQTPVLVPTPTWTVGAPGNPAGGTPAVWNPGIPTATSLPPIRVVVYYDENNNQAPDPAEGIRGATVILLDVSVNKPIAWAETDDSGFASFTPPAGAEYALRVSIPFLGFSKPTAAGQRVEVRIAAQRLPGLIP